MVVVAVTVFDPGAAPKVSPLEDRPFAPVVFDALESEPPPPVTAQVTVAPETGFE